MKTTDKGLNEFLDLITKLEPGEFLGIAKLFGVKLVEKKDVDCAESIECTDASDDKVENSPDRPGYDIRDAADILNDIIEQYMVLGRKGRRNVLKLLRTAVK